MPAFARIAAVVLSLLLLVHGGAENTSDGNASGKPLLAEGRSCMRKCYAEVTKRWEEPCLHLQERLKVMNGDIQHEEDSLKNALRICKQGVKDHREACSMQCFYEEL
uniref:Uncharacterized protein n=1 Tax=Alexandrium andersonii TaxID=327968 RepID=A0A7S2GHV7_9DINO|mmetsp:Transcript_52486/g.118548  ORF Transcript_52486/g.118548 Transcript_52486/m.118548 type:complete len:107 (+) Transcript_52486:87-407(+)